MTPVTPDIASDTASVRADVPAAADQIAAPLLPRRLRRALYIALPLWFALALAWLAPAQLLPTLLRGPLPQLQLGSVAGSFWHGRAASAQWLDGSRVIALGAVEWRIEPWALLLLQLRLQVGAEYGEQFANARAKFSPLGGIELREVRAALPATTLRALAPLPVNGLVTLSLAQLSLQSDGALNALDGELQWQRAAWQWEQRWLPLGDYRCQLHGSAVDQFTCRLDGGSAAQIKGAVDVDLAQRRYRLDGELQLGSELPEQLRSGAGLLLGGDSRGDGRWQLQREGSW